MALPHGLTMELSDQGAEVGHCCQTKSLKLEIRGSGRRTTAKQFSPMCIYHYGCLNIETTERNGWSFGAPTCAVRYVDGGLLHSSLPGVRAPPCIAERIGAKTDCRPCTFSVRPTDGTPITDRARESRLLKASARPAGRRRRTPWSVRRQSRRSTLRAPNSKYAIAQRPVSMA
jgi:hypothetical protein